MTIRVLVIHFQVTTHVEKERVRYFQDDDNLSLNDLVRNEKMRTAEDQNKLFMRMASKVRPSVSELILKPNERFQYIKNPYFQLF